MNGHYSNHHQKKKARREYLVVSAAALLLLIVVVFTCRSNIISNGITTRQTTMVDLAAAATTITAAAAAVTLNDDDGMDPYSYYKLRWSDEFDDKNNTLNTSKWVYRSLGETRNDAMYTKDAVRVSNGILTITTYTTTTTATTTTNTPTTTMNTSPRIQQQQQQQQHNTGMISTQNNKFLSKKGYWEAKILFNTRSGMHSAFWLQSPTIGRPMGAPTIAGVEIDIMEHRYHDYYTPKSKNTNHTTDHTTTSVAPQSIESIWSGALHWDGYGPERKSVGTFIDTRKNDTGKRRRGILKNGEWNTYGVQWDDQDYIFYFNQKPLWKYTGPAISNRTQYIILSSEVHNNSWSGLIPDGGGYVGNNTATMHVDYVRVYDYVEPKQQEREMHNYTYNSISNYRSTINSISDTMIQLERY